MHRTEAPCGPCRSESGQARNGCRAARDDHFLALFRPLNEARELCLGRVDGMSLLHTIHLSQGQLAKQPVRQRSGVDGRGSEDGGDRFTEPRQAVPRPFESSKPLNSKDLGVLVDQTGASWNPAVVWLRQLAGLRLRH